MRNTLLAIAAAMLLALPSQAQELPQPSQSAKLMQQIGLTKFTVKYSRPNMKGRTIFGDLVPYDQVWRTGANASTKINFDTPVWFDGKELAAGEYALYTIPGTEKWTIIIHKNTTLWGASGYNKDEDAMRFEVKAENAPMTETFSINFENVVNDSAHLVLQWADKAVKVPFKVDSATKAKANIDAKMKEMEGAFSVYNNSARYYLDADLDKAQALVWAKKSVEMSEKFWNVYTLSLAYAANSDYNMARKMAQRSLELAKKANYGPYIKMNEENIKQWAQM